MSRRKRRGPKTGRLCAGCGRAFQAKVVDARKGPCRHCKTRPKGPAPSANRVASAVTPPKPRQAHADHAGRAGAGHLRDVEVWGPLRTKGPEFQFADAVRK